VPTQDFAGVGMTILLHSRDHLLKSCAEECGRALHFPSEEILGFAKL